MFKIETTVPLAANGAGAPRKYPIYDMAVEQSFFVPGEDTQGNAAQSARMYGRRVGKKFSARTMDGGVRIWRTA